MKVSYFFDRPKNVFEEATITKHSSVSGGKFRLILFRRDGSFH